MKLAVILGTVREGRQTERLSKWVVNVAQTLEGTEVELLDLKDYPLEFMGEPISPRFNPDRTLTGVVKQWLARLEAAEAYVFVTPEYNHSIPGVLKNAIDYIDWQIAKKPATVVSHGTVGGARATMHLKEILSESRAIVIPSQVAFPGRVGEMIDAQGNLAAALRTQEYGPTTSLTKALNELKWYSDVLAAARRKDL